MKYLLLIALLCAGCVDTYTLRPCSILIVDEIRSETPGITTYLLVKANGDYFSMDDPRIRIDDYSGKYNVGDTLTLTHYSIRDSIH